MTVFNPSPTMREFMLSPAYVKVLAGPIGGGKSVCCVYELLRRAQNQKPNAKGVRRSKWLIVRNTAEQLKQTTFQTFTEWVQPGVAGEWKVSDKTFYLRAQHPDGTIIEASFLFIALDTPDDVRKALSLECTGLWGNECRELNSEVVNGLISRANRFPPMSDGGATEPGAIFDTNMPELESWWGEKMTDPPKNWSIHIQPPALIPDTERVNPNADNLENLAASYYPNQVAGRPVEWVNVYLRAQYGFSQSGLPVFKAFKEHIHVAKKPLLYNPKLVLVVGLDPGLGGTGAAIGQMDLFGRLVVLDEIVCRGVGALRFVDDYLKPLLKNKYPDADIVISIDPAADNRTQIDEMTVSNSLRKRGFVVKTAHTNKIDARISAVDYYLNRLVDGEAAILIDAGCKGLIRAMAGGYKYNITAKGVTATEPCKDKHSHIADGLQYLCCYFQRDNDRLARRQAKMKNTSHHKPACYTGY
jgi:hypothetical protein